jgi:uncharacterized protein (DUF2236 family)
MVSREDLERCIEEVRAHVADPNEGIHGPASMSWKINREAVLFVGGGAAALLQLAHPFVAYGVDQHSKTKTDPLGRFQRTFDNVLAMNFGTLDQAIKSAERVHRVHERIVGTINENAGDYTDKSEYQANTESALFWVHATLLDTAVRVYEACVRKLSADEKEKYYQESYHFAALFGISQENIPKTWIDFQQYMADTCESGELVVTEPAMEMRKFLLRSPTPSLRPLFAWLEVMSAGFMHPRFRKEFGFRYEQRERAIFGASIVALRVAIRMLPAHLRYGPAYMAAKHRLSGKQGRDEISAFVERLALRGIAVVSPRQKKVNAAKSRKRSYRRSITAFAKAVVPRVPPRSRVFSPSDNARS